MPSVFIKTLGCKVNAFDSRALAFQLRQHGFSLSADAPQAEVIIINSCSVTARAEREALYYARRLRRLSPQSFLVITGCYAQTNSGPLSEHPEIDFVVPNSHKPELVALLSARLQRGQGKLPVDAKPVTANRQAHFKLAQTLSDHVSSSTARQYVKVQDGCNGFCSYCIIPYARGASISVPPVKVIAQIKALTEQGCGEIILTGVHLGDYGVDLAADKKSCFVELLQRLFALPKLQRLRISSLEPSELSDDLLQVLAEHRDIFCPHFHLPLQSGSNKILRKMRRKYTLEKYHERLQAAQAIFPQAMFGSDVICGFPSEDEHDHQATLTFAQRAGLHYLHVFPYSPRPNTLALRMGGHLPPATIKARGKELSALSQELKKTCYQSFIGTQARVLWEQPDDNEMLGYSRNYLRVRAPLQRSLLHTETSVSLVALKTDNTLQATH